MGEAKRKRSATQRLIAEFPDCCFCGGLRRTATREHMPPTSLFDNSHRPDGLVMPACEECNKGTSKADLAVALLSRWRSSCRLQPTHCSRAIMRGRQLPTLARLCFDVSVELSVSSAALHCLQCFNARPVLCWARPFGKCQKRQKSSADEVFASVRPD